MTLACRAFNRSLRTAVVVATALLACSSSAPEQGPPASDAGATDAAPGDAAGSEPGSSVEPENAPAPADAVDASAIDLMPAPSSVPGAPIAGPAPATDASA